MLFVSRLARGSAEEVKMLSIFMEGFPKGFAWEGGFPDN